MTKIGDQQTTNIELSEIDARLFVEFQKNYNTFCILQNSGVFNIRNGNAVVHFNRDGVLCEVDVNTVNYKKGLPVIVIHS